MCTSERIFQKGRVRSTEGYGSVTAVVLGLVGDDGRPSKRARTRAQLKRWHDWVLRFRCLLRSWQQ